MAYSCPLGNTPMPISIDANIMLRKDGNGTSLIAIAKYPATHTKVVGAESDQLMNICSFVVRYDWRWPSTQ